MNEHLTNAVLACVASFSCYFLYNRSTRRSLPLPPSPKGYPFFGNALDIPAEATYEKYHEWCKELGSDIIHLNIAGRNVIVLDSYEAALDLLEKRSSIYSDRPSMVMLFEVMQCNFDFAMIPYGDRWRGHRRLMHQVFHPTAGKDLKPHMLKCTHNLLRRLLERPGEVMGHLRHSVGETIINVTYGLDVQPENDPYIKVSKEGGSAIGGAAIAGAFLVDSIPILKYVPEWMPGAGFKTKARKWKAIINDMMELPFSDAKDRIKCGKFVPSLVSDGISQINDAEDYSWREFLLKSTAGTMYSAGMDTTSAVIGNCILALLKHPEVLKRAQEQVDSVLPLGDLPTFEDEDKLPLITAICMEAMRWRDVMRLSIPHLLTKDDFYRGYLLPKGSVIVPNAWAMLHDERVYPDPFEFKIDRFLKDGKIDKNVRDPAHAAYGFGRRMCPGRFMAFSLIWITVASLVATCDITNPVDEAGNPIETDAEYECHTAAVKPKAFTCSIKPRSKKHELAILATKNQEYMFNW